MTPTRTSPRPARTRCESRPRPDVPRARSAFRSACQKRSPQAAPGPAGTPFCVTADTPGARTARTARRFGGRESDMTIPSHRRRRPDGAGQDPGGRGRSGNPKILELFLGEKGFRVKMADGAAARPRAAGPRKPIDLILSDGTHARHERARSAAAREGAGSGDPARPHERLLVVKDAVEAIQLGAADYVEKPIDFPPPRARAAHGLLEKRQLSTAAHLEQRLQGCVTFEGMVACSQQMLSCSPSSSALARYPTTALVLGESARQELVARALHNLSPLRERPRGLQLHDPRAHAPRERALGHMRGSFTRRGPRRKGSRGGPRAATIFLDEIGELPVACR